MARSYPPPASRLLDLPTELRLSIYESIVFDEGNREERDSDETIGRPPSPPGILETSRAVRQEAIGIWYSSVRFPIQFRRLAGHDRKVEPTGTPFHEMIVALPSPAYSMIRKFELCFTQSYGMNAHYYCYSVDLDACNNSYTLEHKPKTDQWWVGYRPWNMDAHKRAERRARCLGNHFDTAVAEMIARNGGVKSLSLHSYAHLVPEPSWRFGDDLAEES